MTLWQRTADGLKLCAVAVGLAVFANALIGSGIPGSELIGGALGLFAYFVSFPMIIVGSLLILVGILGHIREIYRRRRTDA
jgi:uncharacterized membrane protein YidH (DUF202 family)